MTVIDGFKGMRNVFVRSVRLINESFAGFAVSAQKRRPDGSFVYTNPTDCSPQDNSTRSYSLQADNEVGFYESSSWEYGWYVIIFQRFALHDTANLVQLISGNVMS